MKKTIIFLTIFLMFLTGANIASAASGSVLDFDGSDYLTVADDAVLDQNNRLSLSVWAKPDAAGDAYVLYRANAYYLKLTSSCTIEGAIYYAAAFQTITSSAIACDGTAWTHIELVYDKDAGGTDELKLYINGALSVTGDHSTAIADTNTALYLGAQDSTPTLPFDGKIDDFKLYQYARIADGVNTDYNDGKAAHLGENNQRSDGLVGHWSFEEGSGQTISDRSGNGNDGTLGANDSVGKDDPVFAAGHDSNGPGGTGMSFDGVDDYVLLPDLEVFGSDGTFTAWAKLDTDGSSCYLSGALHYFYTMHCDSNNTFNFCYAGASDEKWYAFIKGGNVWNSVGSDCSVGTELNSWNHFAVTWTSTGALQMYKNGKLEDSNSTNSLTFSGTPTYRLGRYWSSDSNKHLDGFLDEARIYNRALSADEIRMLYNQKKPIFHAKMDEGSGQIAYDESWNNNDGTLGSTAGSDANDPTWTTGKFGSGLDFDGTDDYVEVTDSSSLELTSDRTFSAWIYPEGWGESNYGRIFDKSNAPTVTAGYTLHVLSSHGAITNSFGFGNYPFTDPAMANDNTISLNTWQYVTAVCTGSNQENIQFYVNGAVAGSGITTAYNTDSTNPLRIGQRNDGNREFDGLIDDVRIYNYARTADEVKTDYNAGKAAHLGQNNQRSDGLVGHWNFEEGSGQTISDRSGNGNDGTLGANSSVGKDDPVFAAGHDSSGPGGTGMSFDGVDDYVDIGNLGLFIDGADSPGTYSSWVKLDTDGSSCTIPPSRYFYLFQFYLNSGNRIRFYYDGSSGSRWSFVYTGTAVTNSASHACSVGTELNSWNHFALTWTSNGHIELYMNGQLDDSASDNNIDVEAITSYTIRPTATIGGWMDETRIYNRVLSADEIRMLYNQKKPIFHAKMDEGSGQTAYDESFNDNDGTLGSTPGSDANDPTWTTGKFGSGLDFDGVDDYVSVSDDASLELASDRTFTAWIYPEGWGEGSLGRVLDKSNSPTHTTGYTFFISSNYDGKTNSLHIINYGVAPNASANNNVISLNKWQYVTAVMTGAGQVDVQFYVDGAAAGSDTAATYITDSTNPLLIGQRNDGNREFDGLIDDVRIYNYARTAEEIRVDYNNGLAARLR